MRLFCVTRSSLEDINRSLEAAAQARAIEFVPVSPTMIWLPLASKPTAGDLVYRAATDVAAERAEALLLGPGISTFHVAPGFVCSDYLATLVRIGLPVPRTVFNVTNDPDRLRALVEALGGFPVVLKRAGTEGGRGVLVVEDASQLQGAVGLGPEPEILQELVAHDYALRLVVVGDRVIASHEAAPPPGDIRSNALGARMRPVTPPPEAEALAARAVAVLGLEFGGVDLLIGDEGDFVIAEVNFPCHFVTTEELTGIDIAGAMIDHLVAETGGRR